MNSLFITHEVKCFNFDDGDFYSYSNTRFLKQLINTIFWFLETQ